MTKVAFISSDWSQSLTGPDGQPVPGGAGYYRCRLPMEALNRFCPDVEAGHFPNMGADRKTGEIKPQDWAGEYHDGYDVIVFQRWMQDHGELLVRHAQSLGQVIVNDVDDWFDGLDPSNIAFIHTHPKYNPASNREHYRRILAASDMLWVSTPYLAERLRKLRVPTFILRNMIDLSLWSPRPVSDSWTPTLGWVGATLWRSGDLETLAGVVGPVVEQRGLRFIHGGFHPGGDEVARLVRLPGGPRLQPGDEVTLPEGAGRAGLCCVRDMVPIDEYPSLFDGIEVGLAPLRDAPFNRAKSAVKVMEYSAAGIPFIAPRFGEYEAFGAGALVSKPVHWRRALERLCDPAERAAQRQEQLWRVAAEDITLRWPEWRHALGYSAVCRGRHYVRMREFLDGFEQELRRRDPDLLEQMSRPPDD